MPSPRNGSARQRLLDAAAQLFYRDGISATGIDAITARAGVAKMSLYNNFKSKAELVEAFIEQRHEQWLGLYQQRLHGSTTAQERILAVFDAYADHANQGYEQGFRGCGLLNAAAELPVGDAGREAVRRHKEQVQALLAVPLAELAGGLAEEQVQHLALHLSFLLEGAMSRAGLEGCDNCVLQARHMAVKLLEAL